ncbi:protein KRI1 homolog [Cuculus canorus]|uniref:protein KRI1 homolog n=1 Tax=Cuculus canorus TaxID=55661 RepID=UPI0023AA7B7A|nr:protein KRI1 homolog [Cuculus canorus]
MAAPALRINAAFAKRYGRYRRREELQRLEARYGHCGSDSDTDSDSDSSGNDGAVPPPVERDFYRTLALLKSRDPRIYRPDTTFYTQPDSSSESEEEEEKEKEEERPLFLKDYERKVVLEKEGKYVDEEDEEDEEAAAKRKKVTASRSYAEEQKELKESFRAFVADSEEEEEEGGGSALLRPRSRTPKEKEEEEEDYVRWLKGQGGPPPPEPLQDLAPLRQFWSDPDLDPGERFLRDYILERGYRHDDSDEGGDQGAPPDSSDEGELFLARQEDFERRYNFRFEEPGAEQVQTFPRQIPSSVRRRDERRKEKRERLKEKKKKARLRAQQELQQLKNLRRAALSARLQRLRDASGDALLRLPHHLLRGDFHPERHDRAMAECFGEEYYGLEETEKPQFQEEEEEEEDDWNWDSWSGRAEAEPEPHCEDPDFVMDADYEAAAPPPPKRHRSPPANGNRRRKSRFREALEREKPRFDPADGPFERYVDEFYSLDYEDLIGDLPCRFKYRRVVPCDFGLTTEEILAADDKELNRWCSLRKTCMYRSEQEERQDQANYSRRARDGKKKLLILKSLAEGPEPPPLAPAKPKVGKKSREKRKRLENGGVPPSPPKPSAPPKPSLRPPRAPKVRLGGREFTGGRLAAFGLNPRRLRFRQLRRKKGGAGTPKKGGGRTPPP